MKSASQQKQDQLLKRRALERRADLRKAMDSHTRGVVAAEKCSSCGCHPCQCLCDPECPTCGGSGYFRDPFAKVGEPGFGKLSRCPRIPAKLELIFVGGSHKEEPVKKGKRK